MLVSKNILSNFRIDCIEAIKKEADFNNTLKILQEYNKNILNILTEYAKSKVKTAVLIAMGSFSRMQLSPYSDIDLLLIHEKNDEPDNDIRDMVYGFYDADFDISISTRTIDETIDVSKYSYKTLFSVFEPIYIAGDKNLFEKFITKFSLKINPVQHIKKINEGLFFDAEKRQQNNNVLMPNLKESAGALRELSVCEMLCKIFKIDSIESTISNEKKFLYLIRSYLHAFSGRKTDVLNEEVLDDISKLLNVDNNDFRRKIILSLRNGLVLYRGILADISNSDTFWSQITTKRFSDNKKNTQPLQKILSSKKKIEKAFWSRELHNQIPEFEEIEGYVDRVGFHILPVDEHSVQVLREFYDLVSEENTKDYTFMKDLAVSLDQQDREILLTAMLLHDIGKGKGGGHSEKGKQIAEKILTRYQLQENVIESVKFLIENHLLIYTAMTKRDLESVDVISELANKIDGIANLDKLSILSFCDMKATNPNAVNSWNYELLKTLYSRIKKHIDGDSTYIKPENVRLWAIENKKTYDAKLDSIILNLPNPYLKYHSQVDIYDTAVLLHNMYESGILKVSFEPKPITGYALLKIAMPCDNTGLFYKINTVLSQFGASVIYASVHTMKNGAVFDLFRVSGSVVFDKFKMNKLKTKLENVLLNKELLEAKQDKSLTSCIKDINKDKQNIIIKFNNNNDAYTQMELECNDRKNLLTNLSNIFLEFDFNISFAKISTFGKIALDVFHLSQKSKKIDELTLEKLKTRLYQIL